MTAALIERLEKAEAGSRGLDALICDALIPERPVRRVVGNGDYDGNRYDRERLIERSPTTSLDAALALAERVLPADPDFRPKTPSVGWKINLYRGMIPTDQQGGWFANLRRHATDGFDGSSESPALALCIAILKAVAAQSTTEQVGTEPQAKCTIQSINKD